MKTVGKVMEKCPHVGHLSFKRKLSKRKLMEIEKSKYFSANLFFDF